MKLLSALMKIVISHNIFRNTKKTHYNKLFYILGFSNITLFNIGFYFIFNILINMIDYLEFNN